MDLKIDGRPGKSISSNHVQGAAVLFADGRVELLERETATATIKQWLLISDQFDATSGAK